MFKITVVTITTLMSMASSFGSERTLECQVDKNASHTALVAGSSFKLKVDSNMNPQFGAEVKLSSAYLGQCRGTAQENSNALAEGWNMAAEVSGALCAADGFDLFVDSSCLSVTGKDCLVQINSDPEDVWYSCR